MTSARKTTNVYGDGWTKIPYLPDDAHDDADPWTAVQLLWLAEYFLWDCSVGEPDYVPCPKCEVVSVITHLMSHGILPEEM